MPRSKIIGPQGNLGIRNLIINGAMQVSQRGTTGTTPTTDNYLLDRFALSRFGGYPDNATQTQESDAPTGHYKSFKMVRNSAHTLTGTNASAFLQRIEGQNMAHLNWGSSTAKSCTISFWVKSNQTGDFPLILADSGNAFDIGKLYTISSANTWEHKKINIEAPTAGTFDTDNTDAVTVYWGFGAVDAARTAQGTTWGSSNSSGSSKSMVTGASTALATTSGATWQITGVQMEIGDTATDFEHRSFGDELAKCQRYFARILGNQEYIGQNYAGDTCDITIFLPTTMRARPAITTSDTQGNVNKASVYQSGSYTHNISAAINTGRSREHIVMIRNTGALSPSGTVDDAVQVQYDDFQANAEL